MHWQQLLTIIGCLSVIVGSGLVWIWSRMNKKFDQVDKRIHKIHIQLSVLKKYRVVKLKDSKVKKERCGSYTSIKTRLKVSLRMFRISLLQINPFIP